MGEVDEAPQRWIVVAAVPGESDRDGGGRVREASGDDAGQIERVGFARADTTWIVLFSLPYRISAVAALVGVNRFLRAAAMSLSREALMRHAEQHGELVDILASGDVEAGRDAISHHIADAMNRIKLYSPPGEHRTQS